MIVIGAFEFSIELEQLLAKLESMHIQRKYIKVVPMDFDPKNPFQLTNKKHDLIFRGIEIGIASAALCSLLGACFGFILKWGPVIWGMIASIIGFATGFGLYILFKKLKHIKKPKILQEIIVLVQCQNELSDLIADNMWKYRALSVGRFEHPG